MKRLTILLITRLECVELSDFRFTQLLSKIRRPIASPCKYTITRGKSCNYYGSNFYCTRSNCQFNLKSILDAGQSEFYTTPVPTTSPKPEKSIQEVNASPVVHVETISIKGARVEWSAVKEKGIPASRCRVICKTNVTT
ncbi:hypothetical protein Aperf_G00000113163 [Anoplocephala perfoliata]